MKLGLNISLNRVKAFSGGSYESETQAVFDYAVSQGYTQPSENTKTQLDTLVSSLKTSGAWSKIDVLYVFATDGDEDFAKINIKSPGDFQATLYGTNTFTAKQGYYFPDGSNGIDSNWSPGNDGVNFQLNSASVFIHTFDDIQHLGGTQYMCYSVTGSDRIEVRIDTPTSDLRYYLNQSTLSVGAQVTTKGTFHVDRPNSGNVYFYHNGVQVSTDTDASTAVPTGNLLLCDRVRSFTSIAGMGASLVSEKSDINTAFSNYLSNI